MKDKIYSALQTFSRAIIQPVMFMAVAGIIVAFSAILRLEQLPTFLNVVGEFFFTTLVNGMISNLGVIFAVGIAAAMVPDKKTDAAILGITGFMLFLYANNFWLDFTGRLAESGEFGLAGTGQGMVLGVQVTDMGVFLGIVIGTLTGYIVNKFKHVKFHKYLSPYEGTKFAFLILIMIISAFSIVITYIWPTVNGFINLLVDWMARSGAMGFFGYGFVNRMALPFGLHHLLWMPLYYTPLGGTATIVGEQFHGAMNIWLGQIGNISQVESIHSSIGYLVNFGYTALPLGITMAIIKTADTENKKKVIAILIPALVASMLAGITEPIEFIFLFTSPILWLAHAIIYGFGLWLSSVLGLHTFVGNVIETLLYALAIPMELGRQWLIPIIFVVLAVLEYFVFKFMIEKMNLSTLGRGEMSDMSNEEDIETSTDVNSGEPTVTDVSLIIDGLGGPDNVDTMENCYTRLRINVHDESKVNEEILQKYPSSGVIKRGKNVQIIIGLDVEDVKNDVLREMKR